MFVMNSCEMLSKSNNLQYTSAIIEYVTVSDMENF